MCVCGVSRNDESTWFVRVGSGSLPLSLGQDAISRGYMTGDALAQTSLSRVYDNVVYSITQCSGRQHVHTVFCLDVQFVITNICVCLYVLSVIIANAITLLASRVARAMPIVLASMRFANSWGQVVTCASYRVLERVSAPLADSTILWPYIST